jgi:hypothetical protein
MLARVNPALATPPVTVTMQPDLASSTLQYTATNHGQEPVTLTFTYPENDALPPVAVVPSQGHCEPRLKAIVCTSEKIDPGSSVGISVWVAPTTGSATTSVAVLDATTPSGAQGSSHIAQKVTFPDQGSSGDTQSVAPPAIGPQCGGCGPGGMDADRFHWSKSPGSSELRVFNQGDVPSTVTVQFEAIDASGARHDLEEEVQAISTSQGRTRTQHHTVSGAPAPSLIVWEAGEIPAKTGASILFTRRIDASEGSSVVAEYDSTSANSGIHHGILMEPQLTARTTVSSTSRGPAPPRTSTSTSVPLPNASAQTTSAVPPPTTSSSPNYQPSQSPRSSTSPSSSPRSSAAASPEAPAP